MEPNTCSLQDWHLAEIITKYCLRDNRKYETLFNEDIWHSSLQLDIVGHIDTLMILLSPRQVHLLVDLFGAFSSGGEHPYGNNWWVTLESTFWPVLPNEFCRNRMWKMFLCIKVHRNGLRIERADPCSRRMSIDSIWNWTAVWRRILLFQEQTPTSLRVRLPELYLVEVWLKYHILISDIPKNSDAVVVFI